MKTHKIRIIAGLYKGRRLDVLTSDGLRPTTDRIRETLFNWLSTCVKDLNCLDLFAGSGALGIEALSRGAAKTTFVEKDKRVYSTLKNNLHFLPKENTKLHLGDAKDFLHEKSKHNFDLIFFDPPYDMPDAKSILKKALTRLNDNGIIFVEAGDMALIDDLNLEEIKSLKTKKVNCGLYQISQSM